MFDPFSETPITLAKARKLVPGRRAGGVNIATIHRWQRVGVHGIRLETVLIGGVRHTSREAISRFIAATTEKASPVTTAPPEGNAPKSEQRSEAQVK